MDYWIFISLLLGTHLLSPVQLSLLPGDIQTHQEQCSAILSTDQSQYYAFPLSVNKAGSLSKLQAFNSTSQVYIESLAIELVFRGTVHQLNLRHNSRLISENSNQFVKLKGLVVPDGTQFRENCYYIGYCSTAGHVTREDFIAISICHGLSGVMSIDGVIYYIQPHPELEVDACYPHTLTPASVPQSNLTCSHDGSQWTPFEQLHRTGDRNTGAPVGGRTGRNLASRTIRLAVVYDSEMLSQFAYNTERIQKHALMVTNLIDLIYQKVNIRVSLTHYVVWSEGDPFRVTSSPRENLQNFLAHTQASLRDIRVDVTHLITGVSMQSVGIAVPEAICTDRSRAVISAYQMIDDIQRLASVISHMIGHNLGLQPDSSHCTCSGEGMACVMDPNLGGSSPHLSFSACSIDRLQILGHIGLGTCLTDSQQIDPFLQFCGNGVLERGEQCDCGFKQECRDPCCDATTCLLKSWAVCRSGECCENCLPKVGVHMCRPAVDDCDAPEHCDGVTGECPADDNLQDGELCDNGVAFCYQGRCPTRTAQCVSLWGLDSTASDTQCFQLNNRLGNEYGHCGVASDGNQRRCPDKDVMCGLLQCQGGFSYPMSGELGYRKTMARVADSVEIECKSVNNLNSSHIFGLGMVADGSKCGDNSLCQDSVCVSISQLNLASCPTSPFNRQLCSGHGRCTTSARCSCDPGYTGETCHKFLGFPDTPTSLDGKTTPDGQTAEVGDRKKHGPVVLAVCVSLLLITAAVITLFVVFRQRICRRFQKTKKNVTPQTSSLIENPSYDHVTELPMNEFGTFAQPNYSSYRHKRRRRRRHSSSSSSADSESDENLPTVTIYNVPDPSAPTRGILKKPMNANRYSYSSVSQCSNGECQSCTEDEDTISDNPRTPEPIITDESSVDIKMCMLPGQRYVKERLRYSPTNSHYPNADSGVSTESENNHQISPPSVREKDVSEKTIMGCCASTSTLTHGSPPLLRPPSYHEIETQSNFIRSHSMDADLNELDSPTYSTRPENGPTFIYKPGSSSNRRLKAELNGRARSHSMIK